jgi:hypothetical protein
MTLTVRSLLAKVRPFRKDLEEDRALYAIQESVRKICRQTMMAEEVLTIATIASQGWVQVTPTNGDALRVKLVRSYTNIGGPGTPTFAYKTLYEWNQDQIDAFESFRDYPDGTPTGWTYYGGGKLMLYPDPGTVHATVTASFATNVMTVTGVTSGQVLIGDLVVQTGVANPTYITAQTSGTSGGVGEYTLSTSPGTILSGTVTTGNFVLEVTTSYVPQNDIETIPLPDESEDCIVAGALSTLLMLPGAGQNLALAKDRELYHNREIGTLRSIAEFGQSGRLRASGRVLATRSIRSNANRWF